MIKFGSIVLGVSLLGLVIVKGIFGQTPIITPSPAPQLVGQVEQELVTYGGDSIYVPQEPSDYISKVTFFDNQHWAIVKVTSNKPLVQSGWLVFEKKNDVFQSVLGPGTSFSQDDTLVLPVEVNAALTELGVLYNE